MTRRAPTVALAAAGAAAYPLASYGLADPLDIARLAILGAVLGATVATDLREHRIPNRLVLPAAAACAALSISNGAPATGLLTGTGAVLVLLAFSALQPAAIGMGDIKLAVLIAFGLDGDAAQALLLGFGLAAIFGLLVILRRGGAAARTALPLAPFLATGSLLALLA